MDLEKFVSGLALAAITGLTFIAYKHPRAFDRMYLPMYAILTICVTSFLAWDFSASATFKALAPYIDKEKIAEASLVLVSKSTSSWVWVGYVAFSMYMVFLNWLPYILKKDEPPKS